MTRKRYRTPLGKPPVGSHHRLMHDNELTPHERREQAAMVEYLLAGKILEEVQTPSGPMVRLNRTGAEGYLAATLLFRMLDPSEQGALFTVVLDTYRQNIFSDDFNAVEDEEQRES